MEPWQTLRCFSKIKAMCHEGFHVHLAALQHPDNLPECLRQSSAACHHGQLAAVKIWVIKTQVPGKKTKEDDSSAMLRQVESRFHRSGAACCVNNGGRRLPKVGAQLLSEVRTRVERRSQSHALTRKSYSIRLHVHTREICSRSFRRYGRRQSYRPKSDHGGGFASLQRRAFHAMRSDDERLDKRDFLRSQRRG